MNQSKSATVKGASMNASRIPKLNLAIMGSGSNQMLGNKMNTISLRENETAFKLD